MTDFSTSPGALRLSRVVGSDVTITRPNDVVPYTGGDVMGADGGDARIALGLPATPTGLRLIGIRFIFFDRNASGSAQTFNMWTFTSQPATVIADNSPLALSDADIDLIVGGVSLSGFQAAVFNLSAIGAQGVTLNMTAAASGRRVTSALVMGDMLQGTGYSGIVPPTLPIPTHAYLWTSGAYTPIAQEVFVLRPVMLYLPT